MLIVGVAAFVSLPFTLPVCAQYPSAATANSSTGQPIVIHIHNHYYSQPGLPGSELGSYYAPSSAWNFGYQPGTGNFISPFSQNWGHLGFTAYLGQHGGGVDVTPESFNVFVGLVVNTVTPGSPASKIGLVPGDFILKIDGTAVDSYKQVANLFEQSEQGSKPEIDLTVWNPTTRRTSVLKAILDKK